jgi:chemotaxis protein CheC
MDLQEPLGGRLLLLLAAEEAERVSQRLVPEAAAGSLDAVGESALVEMGNIAGSAFVSALARRIQGRLLHGVPRLTRGDARSCLDALAPGAAGPALGVRFGLPDAAGTLLLLPDPARLDGLARALGIP